MRTDKCSARLKKKVSSYPHREKKRPFSRVVVLRKISKIPGGKSVREQSDLGPVGKRRQLGRGKGKTR